MLTRLSQLRKLAAIINPTMRQRTADALPTGGNSQVFAVFGEFAHDVILGESFKLKH